MHVKLIDLPKPNPLVEDYIAGSSNINQFFDYRISDSTRYKTRLAELKQRSYKRDQLISVLTHFNQPFGPHAKVTENIQRLSDSNAVVVVGGQQAGLLTGPAFTIHKCLSILQLANEQEKELNVPVIPIFWIAGEDHDFAEVNHVYAYTNQTLRKLPFKLKGSGQTSVSNLHYEVESLEQWVDQVFEAFGETDFTAGLLQEVKAALHESSDLVQFFARLIHDLFGKYGLVLMDSADPDLRSLESDYFEAMIHHSSPMASGVTQQLSLLKAAGYPVNLDQSEKSANLFLTENSQRILLSREQDVFFNDEKGVRLLQEELVHIAQNEPEKLSNNVVTRPIMQDLVLPTLAFIGGPGEVAYWSALAPAFHELGIQMPVVVPRLHLTFVDRQCEKWLESKAVSLADALQGKLQERKEAWLSEQHDWQLDDQLEKTKQAMWQAYQPYRETALALHSELEQLTESNWERIENQLAYLKGQMERHIRITHKSELDRFDGIEAKLLPNGGPQERIWTIYAFLNEYGPDLVDRLMNERYEFNGRQHAVYL